MSSDYCDGLLKWVQKSLDDCNAANYKDFNCQCNAYTWSLENNFRFYCYYRTSPLKDVYCSEFKFFPFPTYPPFSYPFRLSTTYSKTSTTTYVSSPSPFSPTNFLSSVTPAKTTTTPISTSSASPLISPQSSYSIVSSQSLPLSSLPPQPNVTISTTATNNTPQEESKNYLILGSVATLLLSAILISSFTVFLKLRKEKKIELNRFSMQNHHQPPINSGFDPSSSSKLSSPLELPKSARFSALPVHNASYLEVFLPPPPARRPPPTLKLQVPQRHLQPQPLQQQAHNTSTTNPPKRQFLVSRRASSRNTDISKTTRSTTITDGNFTSFVSTTADEDNHSMQDSFEMYDTSPLSRDSPSGIFGVSSTDTDNSIFQAYPPPPPSSQHYTVLNNSDTMIRLQRQRREEQQQQPGQIADVDNNSMYFFGVKYKVSR
ncbi:hypothetical protein HK098_004489 [Nowakowskiella sp. JEL0407]|nr:hypothetical protein HK098_004489 [Nowakowskiella sp. JEL0407]